MNAVKEIKDTHTSFETVEELKDHFGVLNVDNEDIIVLMCEGFMSDGDTENTKSHLSKMFPNNKILILDEGTKLGVAKDKGCKDGDSKIDGGNK